MNPQMISITVLEKPQNNPHVPILHRVRRFQFNNQLLALNHITDASLICVVVFSTS